MSMHTNQTLPDCDTKSGCDAIELTITPKEKDLGGFKVRRALPVRERKMIGPWIFFDHMGPADFPAGQGVNVRPHPHINLATVTYLFDGEILHRDSIGSKQSIRPGEVNLMVAGSGIVHSEREDPELTRVAHSLHGLQLWLALPEKYEETDPAFYHYPSTSIPSTEIDDVQVRVIIGSAYGLTSPVKTFAKTLYLEAFFPKGSKLLLAQEEERAIYVISGKLTACGSEIVANSMTVFRSEDGVELEASEDTKMVLIGGDKLTARYIEWNFVSSRKDRITMAKEKWKNQNFPKVVGDEDDYIPLPD